jgi:O-antigen ligase
VESKSKIAAMKLNSLWISKPNVWIGIFGAIYLAVLPMSGTIALRKVSLLLVLLILSWQFFKTKSVPQFALAVVLWAVYLIFFPLIATDSEMAWKSLGKQWGMGLLAMVAGAGVATRLASTRWGGSFYLGVLSCVTILVYLGFITVQVCNTSFIPWGYWGRETHHADLGYAACQAVLLLMASVVASKKPTKYAAWVLIVACLFATALARSRAGLAFAVFAGAMVLLTAVLSRTSIKKGPVFLGLGALLLMGCLVLGVAAKNDPRWMYMESNIVAGFLGDALQLQCEGTASVEGQIKSMYGTSDLADRAISSVKDGDGSRVVVLRAGTQLALEHPWGSDGSRQAYKKLLRLHCPQPDSHMAHAHNGWVDTALAIGWLGVLLYLWVFIHYIRTGYKALHSSTQVNEWAIVLVTLSVFWIVRAFTDSVFRDHMFEMQGFVLSYAYFAHRATQTKTSLHTA